MFASNAENWRRFLPESVVTSQPNFWVEESRKKYFSKIFWTKHRTNFKKIMKKVITFS